MHRNRLAVALLATTLLAPTTAAARAGDETAQRRRVQASSLPSVGSGHRPGPDILYASPARAPQLENTGIWKAEPILVSGASAYREGEFLYQDFLYDDYGAAGVMDPGDVTGGSGRHFTNFAGSPNAGTFTYPTDPAFANNAADLVELRIKPVGRTATAFRVTLNTLIDPERTAFTIAIGASPDLQEWPHGAGVRSPAELFLTVHGRSGELREAATGALLSPSSRVRVDVRRRQFEVRVPRAAWDPAPARIRMAAGVGLWDSEAGHYLLPGASATDTAPGGAAPSGAALFNLAFRFDEPTPDWELISKAYTIADWLAAVKADGSWWRERAQSEALRDGDITPFFAEVDFAKLAARVEDDSAVPMKGPMNRIYASRYAFGQGVDYTQMCSRPSAPPCVGPFVGRLQTYALYVPDKPRPARGWGLTLLLHGWTVNHNGYLGSKFQSQLGERGAGSLVTTPLARGPDGEHVDIAEADVFEVWADVARHYRLDPDWTVAAGYSMGAGGAYFLSARWPDLFSRAVIAAAVPEGDLMRSLRNIPTLTWIGALDEGTDIGRQEASAERLGELGLRFVFDQFPTADHLTLATNDEWGPVADFLGPHRVERNPHHIAYVVDARRDSERAQVVADHAYWISDLRVRDPEVSPIARIDVRSEGFGHGEQLPLGVTQSSGVVEEGAHGPMPYVRRRQDWGPAPPTPKADRLMIQATNLASVTIDVRRARLSCHPDLRVSSDGPLRITLTPCARVLEFSADE